MGGATRTAAHPVAWDASLTEWLRHYLAVILLITVLGAAGGVVWGSLTTPRAEMWSIVVDTEQLLPARQLGVVAETLFRAEETYRAAIADLRSDLTPEELFGQVELRSVPESRLLIVIATGDDTYSASIVSDAMARSLSAAFAEAGYPGFEILGAPQPPTAPSTVSLPVFAALGLSVGLLVAVGFAVVHFRTRRPVLTLGTASALVRADHVVSVPQGLRWLGMLRHLRSASPSSSARDLAVAQLHPERSTVVLVWPGVRPRKTERLAERLDLDVDPDAARTIVVADAGTRWRDLETDPVALRARDTTLLWFA